LERDAIERVVAERKSRFDSESVRFDFLDREALVRLRLRAMRAGVWFRCLRRIDRVLVDLTIKVADCVRSRGLARRLLLVAGKLEGLLEGRLACVVREFGLLLAERASSVAVGWGNASAAGWACDAGFARFWAVLRLNGHPCGG
jgi:hypothetical protein